MNSRGGRACARRSRRACRIDRRERAARTRARPAAASSRGARPRPSRRREGRDGPRGRHPPAGGEDRRANASSAAPSCVASPAASRHSGSSNRAQRPLDVNESAFPTSARAARRAARRGADGPAARAPRQASPPPWNRLGGSGEDRPGRLGVDLDADQAPVEIEVTPSAAPEPWTPCSSHHSGSCRLSSWTRLKAELAQDLVGGALVTGPQQQVRVEVRDRVVGRVQPSRQATVP